LRDSKAEGHKSAKDRRMDIDTSVLRSGTSLAATRAAG
jgi:hypothetical protein